MKRKITDKGAWHVRWDDFDSQVQCFRVCIAPNETIASFFINVFGHSKSDALKLANKLTKLLNKKEEKENGH